MDKTKKHPESELNIRRQYTVLRYTVLFHSFLLFFTSGGESTSK